jgi:uncharacterized protein DUF6152
MKAGQRWAAAVLLLCGSGVALAHHSYGMFDRENERTVSGVVQEFQWTNPHSRLLVLATDAKGAAQTWTIEIGPPGQLVRTGWKRNSVKPGDKVDVLINPLKDGTPGGRLLMVTLADGQKLYDVVFRTPDGGRGGAAGVGAEVHK